MSHHVVASAADSSQAQYFRRILAERRADLQARLAEDARTLSLRERAGKTCGLKALRGRIRKMERQRSELDRLLSALGPLTGVDPVERLPRAVNT